MALDLVTGILERLRRPGAESVHVSSFEGTAIAVEDAYEIHVPSQFPRSAGYQRMMP